MPVETATITGPVFDQTGANPLEAAIEFRLRTNPRDPAGVVLRGSTVVKVSAAGGFSTPLYRAIGGATVYDVIYRFRPYLGAEWIERDIGPIRLIDGGSRSLASLLPVEITADASDTETIKRGDSISMASIWVDQWGAPISTSGVTIAASMRGPDGVLRSLTVTKGPAASGTFEISMPPAQTADLPIGAHLIDVKFTTSDRVVRSRTGTIIIDQEITP